MAKRSPRYPRHNLAKSLDMIKKLFDGVHQARVDMDTAAKVIGYAGSGGGAASSALGALRQFGLVDGLRGDVAVSDLAMRILEPMNDSERTEALREAAFKPEIFRRVVDQFGGRLPPADEPIRAFLIRQEDFSTIGANELIETLRETVSNLPIASIAPVDSEHSDGTQRMETGPTESVRSEETGSFENVSAPTSQSSPKISELITLPLGHECKAELRLIGEVTVSTYSRLIRHLELLRDIASEENESM